MVLSINGQWPIVAQSVWCRQPFGSANKRFPFERCGHDARLQARLPPVASTTSPTISLLLTAIGLRQRHNGLEDEFHLIRFERYSYVRWLGFVGRQRAKELGKPVKLEINRIGRSKEFGIEWEDVPPGKHVQGCLTRDGAYAVLRPWVRLL